MRDHRAVGMRRRVAVIAALSLAALLGFAVQAQAATFTVGTTSDAPTTCSNPASGTCSLRTLISSVRRGQHDRRAGECQPLQPHAGRAAHPENLTIAGAGARTTTIEHNVSGASARVFDIQPNGSARSNRDDLGLTIEFGRDRLDNQHGVRRQHSQRGQPDVGEDQIQLGQSTGGGGGGISNQGGGS